MPAACITVLHSIYKRSCTLSLPPGGFACSKPGFVVLGSTLYSASLSMLLQGGRWLCLLQRTLRCLPESCAHPAVWRHQLSLCVAGLEPPLKLLKKLPAAML